MSENDGLMFVVVGVMKPSERNDRRYQFGGKVIHFGTQTSIVVDDVVDNNGLAARAGHGLAGARACCPLMSIFDANPRECLT